MRACSFWEFSRVRCGAVVPKRTLSHRKRSGWDRLQLETGQLRVSVRRFKVWASRIMYKLSNCT